MSKNSIGDVSGDHNQIIQVILSGGEEVAEELGVLIEKLVAQEKKEIQTLQELIASKTETIEDKAEIIFFKNKEIIQLKTDLVDKQQQLEENEKRFETLLLENNGKDFTGSKELFPKAIEALMKGNKKEALKILNRHSLLDEKKKLDIEKQQQADAWFLRADLLKSEDTWGEESNECYEMAVDTLSTWSTNLEAANHFMFTNDYTKAEKYYQVCLQKSLSNLEKAITLNNLGNLYKLKTQFKKAKKSYKKSLSIRRSLALLNPKLYEPYVADTLNNLGNLYSVTNKFEKASSFFEKALKLYKELIPINNVCIAKTLNNLGNLQCGINEFEKAENSYKESLQFYKKSSYSNPHLFFLDMWITLNNLGNLQRTINKIEKAEQSYNTAILIGQKLIKSNPLTHLPNFAMTLINMGIYYQESKVNRKLSIELTDKAITILLSFSHIPYTKNYFKEAFQTLKNWDIDVEVYWEEKMKNLEV